jgi:hypothetical protein
MNEPIKYDALPVNVAQPVTGLQPVVEANPFDAVREKIEQDDARPFRLIDVMRADWALARGMMKQVRRRAGLTDWRPTARYNRVAHQGKHACRRRLRQQRALA